MRACYIGLRVPPDLWREIQSAVEHSELTQAQWLRAAVAAALERQEMISETEKLLRSSESRLKSIIRSEIISALSAIEIVDSSTVSEDK